MTVSPCTQVVGMCARDASRIHTNCYSSARPRSTSGRGQGNDLTQRGKVRFSWRHHPHPVLTFCSCIARYSLRPVPPAGAFKVADDDSDSDVALDEHRLPGQDSDDSDWELSDEPDEDEGDDVLTVPDPEELEEITAEEKAGIVTKSAVQPVPRMKRSASGIACCVLNVEDIKQQSSSKCCSANCLRKIENVEEFVQAHRFNIWNKEVSCRRRRVMVFDNIKQTLVRDSKRIWLTVEGRTLCRRAYEIIYGLLPRAGRSGKSSSVSRWIRLVKRGDNMDGYIL